MIKYYFTNFSFIVKNKWWYFSIIIFFYFKIIIFFIIIRYKFITISSDYRAMTTYAKSVVDEMKGSKIKKEEKTY